MSKRVSLAVKRQAVARRARSVAAGKVKAAPQPAAPKGTIVSVHLPPDVLELLRVVAIRRAARTGGRPSTSAVIAALVRAHRTELAAELQ